MAVSVTVYFVIAATLLGAAGFWFIRETGDPTKPVDSIFGEAIKPPPKTRRQELIEARDAVTRQIEILRSPVGGGLRTAPPNVSAEIAELQELLDRINRELD